MTKKIHTLKKPLVRESKEHKSGRAVEHHLEEQILYSVEQGGSKMSRMSRRLRLAPANLGRSETCVEANL
jgi:hypothetical protein